LKDDMKPFDNTWDKLLNKDEEMVESLTDEFGSLSSETELCRKLKTNN